MERPVHDASMPPVMSIVRTDADARARKSAPVPDDGDLSLTSASTRRIASTPETPRTRPFGPERPVAVVIVADRRYCPARMPHDAR